MCIAGYTLDENTGKCLQCGPNCKSCSPKNSSICTLCIDGTYYDSTTYGC